MPHPLIGSLSLAACACLLLTTLSPTLAQTPVPDPRFGAVEAYAAPRQAAELGVGWDRMIFHWNTRQPDGPRQWVVPGDEAGRLEEARLARREVVALLIGTPAWATDGTAHTGVPRGLYLPLDDPGNAWAAFVRRIVAERKDHIRHWIVWNEPDIAVDTYGVQFEGSVDDYYQLLKVAYLAAREADPQAVIHLAGLTYWHDVVHKRESFLRRLLYVARKDKSAAAQHYYFDVFTAHIYFRSETVLEIANFYRGILQQYRLEKPIWINETNAAPVDDPLYPASPLIQVTMEQQAAFIIQSHALALAAGVQRVAVYKLFDLVPPAPGGESYGLFRPDGSPRPAADAYRVVTAHFSGATRVTIVARSGYYLVTLTRGTALTRVAWARRAQPVTLPLRPSLGAVSAALYDPLGVSSPVPADARGDYVLTLAGADCNNPYGCVVGGAPWILVETLAAP
jgi:hypothetical protein